LHGAKSLKKSEMTKIEGYFRQALAPAQVNYQLDASSISSPGIVSLLCGPRRTSTSDQQRGVISGQWMRRGLRATITEITEELMEAFSRFFSEKQQGARCDKHDHFKPAESSQDHHDESNAVLHSPRARVWRNRMIGRSTDVLA
jgi:hypothetical protein